jgi:hypothetical protein
MGGAIEWPGLSGSSRASCCVASVTIKIKFSHRGLHRTSKDERTVKTAHLKPVCSNGPYTAEGFRRTGTRRISSWPGETYPQNRPDTLTQTFFIHQLFPCSQTADHTLRQLHILIPPLRQAMVMTKYGKSCDRPSQGREGHSESELLPSELLEQTSLPPQGSVLLNSGSDEILPLRRCHRRSP